MVYEERIAELEAVIAAKNKFNKIYDANKMNVFEAQEQITEMQKPVVEELKKIESNKIVDKNTLSNETFEETFDVIRSLPKSITPIMTQEKIPGYEGLFNGMKINKTKLAFLKTGEGNYLIDVNDSNKYHELTPTLKIVIEGRGDNTSPADEIQFYLDNIVKKSTDLKYLKFLKGNLINKEGEGYHSDHSDRFFESHNEGEDNIKFFPDNPISLFVELRKLLAAKNAGHNNVYNEVNAICKRLMQMNNEGKPYLTSEKYKKIIKKYFNK